MSDLEMQQVRLRLTKDHDVLGALKKNHQFGKDAGGEFLSVMFNSVEIRFHPGQIVTLGKNVAESIYNRTFVIVGDQLTGEVKRSLEIVEEVNLNDQLVPRAKFACPLCQEDQKNANKLAEHLIDAHTERDEEVEEEVEASA